MLKKIQYLYMVHTFFWRRPLFDFSWSRFSLLFEDPAHEIICEVSIMSLMKTIIDRSFSVRGSCTEVICEVSMMQLMGTIIDSSSRDLI
jgi:hypothetical protein